MRQEKHSWDVECPTWGPSEMYFYSSNRNCQKTKEEGGERRLMGNPGLGPVFWPQVCCYSFHDLGASLSVALDFNFHISNMSWLGSMRAGVPSSANSVWFFLEERLHSLPCIDSLLEPQQREAVPQVVPRVAHCRQRAGFKHRGSSLNAVQGRPGCMATTFKGRAQPKGWNEVNIWMWSA